MTTAASQKDVLQHHASHSSDVERRLSNAGEICLILSRIGINPKSVIDIGCGYGFFLAQAKKAWNARVLGLDGGWVDIAKSQICRDEFIACDIENGVQLTDRYDLAVSLEVAEHLNVAGGEHLVTGLTRCANIVLFSAAIPGQGGQGHVNEQYLDYWCTHFKQRGFAAVDILHPSVWSNEKLFPWFRQNLVIFINESVHLGSLEYLRAHQVESHVLSRVHPVYYQRRILRIKELERQIAELKTKIPQEHISTTP
jgi:SAM-dependent methyltransferase